MKNIALSLLIGIAAFATSCGTEGGDGNAAANIAKQTKILTDLTAEVAKVDDLEKANALATKFTEKGGELKVLADKAKEMTKSLGKPALDKLTAGLHSATGSLSAAVEKLATAKPAVGKIVKDAFNKFKGLAGL